MPFQAGSQTAWQVLNNLSVGALVKFKKKAAVFKIFYSQTLARSVTSFVCLYTQAHQEMREKCKKTRVR